MEKNKREREFTELWLLANDRRATPEQIEALNHILEEDENARHLAIQLAKHQSWMAWDGAAMPELESSIADILSEIHRGAQCEDDPPSVTSPATTSTSVSASSHPERGDANARSEFYSVPLVSFRMAALLAAVAAMVWWVIRPKETTNNITAVAESPVRAEITETTFCSWQGSNGGRLGVGHVLSEGESLQLVEGVARFAIDYDNTRTGLQMEGPCGLFYSQGGVPFLRYGNITVRMEGFSTSIFPIETSFGRVLVSPDSEVGVSSFGDTTQIHVFKGYCLFESYWFEEDTGNKIVRTIVGGEALVLNDFGLNAKEVKKTDANRLLFTPSLTMNSDFLPVSVDYIHRVRSDSPVLYWRFESDKDRTIVNEMGDRFCGKIEGAVSLVGPPRNQAANFSGNAAPGRVVVNEEIGHVVAADYTAEMWVKPSHFQHGCVLSFAGSPDPNHRPDRNRHGVLVELRRDASSRSKIRNREIRFLHRPDFSEDSSLGVSCRTRVSYYVRQWQHIVAVREGEDMRVYHNGELVGHDTCQDSISAPLKMVLGQIYYTDFTSRPYAGFIDEVAIYDRALDEKAIVDHFQLLRSE